MTVYHQERGSLPIFKVNTKSICKGLKKDHPYISKERATLFFQLYLKDESNPMISESQVPKYLRKVYPEFAVNYQLNPQKQTNMDAYFCNLCHFEEFVEYNDIITRKMMRCRHKNVPEAYCQKKFNEDSFRFFSKFYRQFM